jgi:hypothetical protein
LYDFETLAEILNACHYTPMHNMARQLRPFFLSIGAFLPDFEHGSGLGDCVDVGGRCPEEGERPDPAGDSE